MRPLRWLVAPFVCLSLLSCDRGMSDEEYYDLIIRPLDLDGTVVQCRDRALLQKVYRVYLENNEGDFAVPGLSDSLEDFDTHYLVVANEDGSEASIGARVDMSQVYTWGVYRDSETYETQYTLMVMSDPLEGQIDPSATLNYELLRQGKIRDDDYFHYRFFTGNVECFQAVVYPENGFSEVAREISRFCTDWFYLGEKTP